MLSGFFLIIAVIDCNAEVVHILATLVCFYDSAQVLFILVNISVRFKESTDADGARWTLGLLI